MINKIWFVLILLYAGQAIAQGEAYRLNQSLIAAGDVDSFEVSRDNRRVVYTADQDRDAIDGLYMVEINGSKVIKLSPDLTGSSDIDTDQHVFEFSVTSNSQRVIYIAGNTNTDIRSLYTVPIKGSRPAVKLSHMDSGAELNVLSFQIDSNSQRVVFTVAGSPSGIALYSASISGGDIQELSGGLTTLDQFQIAPNAERVIFNTTDDFIHQVPILGGAIEEISTAGQIIQAGESVEELIANNNGKMFEITADSEYVFCLRRFTQFDRGTVMRSQLSQPSVPLKFSGFGDFVSYRLTSDGQKIVYFNQFDGGNGDIYMRETYGAGSQVRISGSIFSNQQGGNKYEITPDNRFVVYQRAGIKSVPISGGTIRDMSGSGGVFSITPNSQRVLTYNGRQIISLPIKSGTSGAHIINPEEPSGETASANFKVSSDSLSVIYLDKKQAFRSATLSGGNRKKLTQGKTFEQGFSHKFEISPKDTHLLYILDQNTEGQFELFAIELNPDSDTCFPAVAEPGKLSILCI